LGLLFRTGDGVTQDEAETVRLWTEAAKLGVVRAQHELGEMMRNGIGAKFEKDEAEAIRLHRLAAEQGHEAAAVALNNYLGG
jgi:uncharacterized protein